MSKKEYNYYKDYVESLRLVLREIKEKKCLTDSEISEVIEYWKPFYDQSGDTHHYLYNAILELKPKNSLIHEKVEKCFWDYEDLHRGHNE